MLLLRKILLKVLLVARYQLFVQLYMYASVIGYVGISLPVLNNVGNIAYASVTADVGAIKSLLNACRHPRLSSG